MGSRSSDRRHNRHYPCHVPRILEISSYNIYGIDTACLALKCTLRTPRMGRHPRRHFTRVQYSPATVPHIGAPGTIRSWDVTIGSLFGRIRLGTFVKKPKQLEWNETYIRTDSKTLIALLVLLNPSQAERPNLVVVYKDVGTVMTAYLKLKLPLQGFPAGGFGVDVSKHEMSCILDGYPPWYRRQLLLANGNYLQHPIHDTSDLTRGGWIAAVGLSRAEPLPYHFILRGKGGDRGSGFSEDCMLCLAFKRVIRGLESLAKAFPDQELVLSARDIIQKTSDDLLTRGITTTNLLYPFITSSFNKVFNQEPWLRECGRDFASGLTDEQCGAIINVFTHYDELSVPETLQLQPILMVVLRVILVGSYHVLGYFQRYERRDFLYPLMRETGLTGLELCANNLIYLRDRQEDDED